MHFLLRLLFFWRASEHRAAIKRDMRTTEEIARAKAAGSQDYWLKRDLQAQDKDETTTRN